METINYEYEIANGKVSTKNVVDNITYCPPHAKGNCGHPDVEHGRISTVDERGIFVKFKANCGAKCNSENLHW
jgi:hypothetical protein